MPSSKFDWLNRVKAVEREHMAVRYAADFLLNTARDEPTILNRILRVRDVEESISHLEGTYIIRLFAEFETCLRSYWVVSRGNEPPSRTRDLLDGTGSKRKIPHDVIRNAHAVREFRNSLVHERDEVMDPLPIADGRRSLCIFLNFLPPQW